MQEETISNNKIKDVYENFYVGVNVFVLKDNKLLLGKRKNIYGAGTWALPGGHLEKNEKMEDAALRELFEETGLKPESVKFVNMVNDIREDEHRIQIGFLVENIESEPINKEIERCEGWKWFVLNDLPKDIFIGHEKQIKAFIEKNIFID